MEAITPHLDIARAEAIRWLGDWHPLVRQIAPGEGVTQPQPSGSSPCGQAIVSPASLRAFLLSYKESVLLPFELPAVKQACEHTLRNEVQELLALDRSLCGQSWFQPYASDSRAAGRLHLERLQPLRDQRSLRRYLAAVEQGEANGWHLLVAGAALGLYSVPLRQGLMDYALHTFWNVVGQTAGPLDMNADDAIELVHELSGDLPRRIQPLFAGTELKVV